MFSEAVSIQLFAMKGWETKSIVEYRTAEINAVDLEGSSSFRIWRCFSTLSLLCPCMMFSAELKKETKQ